MKTLQEVLEINLANQFNKVNELSSKLGFLNQKVLIEREKHEFLKTILDEYKNQNSTNKEPNIDRRRKEYDM